MLSAFFYFVFVLFGSLIADVRGKVVFTQNFLPILFHLYLLPLCSIFKRTIKYYKCRFLWSYLFARAVTFQRKRLEVSSNLTFTLGTRYDRESVETRERFVCFQKFDSILRNLPALASTYFFKQQFWKTKHLLSRNLCISIILTDCKILMSKRKKILNASFRYEISWGQVVFLVNSYGINFELSSPPL